MRIAVLTDIHANREATQAVLAAVGQLAPDRIALLGDIVGYGPDPVFAVETVERLVSDGAICLLGNHDEAAVIGTRIFDYVTEQDRGEAERLMNAGHEGRVLEGDLHFRTAGGREECLAMRCAALFDGRRRRFGPRTMRHGHRRSR